jgi:hypothetical protein
MSGRIWPYLEGSPGAHGGSEAPREGSEAAKQARLVQSTLVELQGR